MFMKLKLGFQSVTATIRTCLKKYWHLVVIFFLAVVFLLPLWIGRGYIAGHDTQYHLSSVLGISELPFPDILNPRIIGRIASDLGFGEGIFYPQISHVLAAVILKLGAPFGMSVFNACRLASLIFLFASGYLMYKMVMLMKGDKRAALLSAILYMGASYHVSDILVRDAAAESALFAFIPVAGISLVYLCREQYKKFLVWFSVAAVGMVNSHFVMTLYVVAFFGLFVLINWRKFFTKKKLLYIVLGTMFAFVLCLPFILPILENRQAAEYMAFSGYMTSLDFDLVSFGSYFGVNLPFNGILWTLNLTTIAFCIYALIKYRTGEDKVLIYSLIAISLLVVALMSILDFRVLPEAAKMIQFPWRLNLILCFTMSLLPALLMNKVGNDEAKIAFGLIGLVASILPMFVWESVVTSTYITEESAIAATEFFGDYLPVRSYNNISLLEGRADVGALVIGSRAEVVDYTDEMPDARFAVVGISVGEKTMIELPRYYYLGYKITVETEDGKSTVVDYYENSRGLIQFEVDNDVRVMVEYTGTVAQRVVTVLALVATVLVIGIAVSDRARR